MKTTISGSVLKLLLIIGLALVLFVIADFFLKSVLQFPYKRSGDAAKRYSENCFFVCSVLY